ncbi:MAG: hypothetical protein WD801_05420 [Gemmatimonadaceae bacterium]
MRKLALVAVLVAAGVTTARAQTQLVIVSGLGGDPRYTREFSALATALAQAARDRGGMPDSAITWFGEASAPQGEGPWYRGTSTRANVEQTLGRLAARESEEQLVLVLIGHGSGEGAQTRISLPGPDLTAADFARLLDAFGDRRVAFINMTSASGDMLPVVAARGRVVVTATKSAFERNESRFGRFFVDALSKDGADSDKDERVSLFEAFHYADAETKRFYESEQRIATEHPQMADEGQLARRFFLSAGAAGAASTDPRVVALYAERAKLEERITALRARKAEMTVEAYEAELERLLVSLAEKSQEIRRLERGS